MTRPSWNNLQDRLPHWWSEFVSATKGWLILLLSLPALLGTVISLAKSNLPGILVNAGGFAAYLLAFSLIRRSARLDSENRGKLMLRTPPPYRWIAAAVAAVTTMAVARLGAGHPAAVSTLFGSGAFLGMYLAYGLEPRRRHRVSPPAWAALEQDDAWRMLDQAERRLLNIEQSGRKIRNPEVTARLGRISSLAKDILTDLTEDPNQIRRSRKFLNVYLDGVEKVVAGYARTHVQVQSEQLEANFRNVLGAIEHTFQEQRQRLLDDDVFDLDVQMEVLATQLKREGLT